MGVMPMRESEAVSLGDGADELACPIHAMVQEAIDVSRSLGPDNDLITHIGVKMGMVPTIKPPPPVEDSHVSNSLWTPTETESNSVSSPCPVCGILPTLPMPKVILYSNPPSSKASPMDGTTTGSGKFRCCAHPNTPSRRHNTQADGSHGQTTTVSGR